METFELVSKAECPKSTVGRRPGESRYGPALQAISDNPGMVAKMPLNGTLPASFASGLYAAARVRKMKVRMQLDIPSGFAFVSIK